MSTLNGYINSLYDDDVSIKEKASLSILKMAIESQSLESLLESETAVSTLVRIMREEYKTLSNVAINLSSVFVTLASQFRFHAVLREAQCGDCCFRALEYELSVRGRAIDEVLSRVKIEYHATRNPKLVEDLNAQLSVLNTQDRLLNSYISTLLYFADDLLVEKKMVNRGLIRVLLSLLCREGEFLLKSCLNFLLKLSIISEYKDVMLKADSGIVSTLAQYTLIHSNSEISLASLKLLQNLSFDKVCREMIRESNLIKTIPDLLRVPPLRSAVIRLLAYLSEDMEICTMISQSDEITLIVVQLTIGFPGKVCPPDLAQLLTNISSDKRGALSLADNGLFPKILERALENADAFLMRIVKTIAMTSSSASALMRNIERKYPQYERALMSAASLNQEGMMEYDSESFFEELIGFFVGLASLEFHKKGSIDLNKFRDIQPIVLNALHSVRAQTVLEAIMFIGNSGLFNSENLKSTVREILSLLDESEDDDIIAQCLFALTRLPSLSDKIIDEESRRLIMSFILSENSEISAIAERLSFSLAVSSNDEELRKLRFARANKYFNFTDELNSPGCKDWIVWEESISPS